MRPGKIWTATQPMHGFRLAPAGERLDDLNQEGPRRLDDLKFCCGWSAGTVASWPLTQFTYAEGPQRGGLLRGVVRDRADDSSLESGITERPPGSTQAQTGRRGP
jgi:hypothetical protein